MPLMRVANSEHGASAISRRALFTLHHHETKRVLELSCEQLYMRYADARAAVGSARSADHIEARDGEPPLAVETPTADQLFASLERELAAADVLFILEARWLTEPKLSHELETRIQAFRERGGEVRFVATQQRPPSQSEQTQSR